MRVSVMWILSFHRQWQSGKITCKKTGTYQLYVISTHLVSSVTLHTTAHKCLIFLYRISQYVCMSFFPLTSSSIPLHRSIEYVYMRQSSLFAHCEWTDMKKMDIEKKKKKEKNERMGLNCWQQSTMVTVRPLHLYVRPFHLQRKRDGKRDRERESERVGMWVH